MVDRCICCGEPIPEGRQVCRKCNTVIEGKNFRDFAKMHLFGEQASAIKEVLRERFRQDLKWGRQDHALERWTGILGEEYGELCEAINETIFDNGTDKGGYKQMRKEAIQVAAVAVAFAEYLDRNKEKLPKEARR